MGHPAGDRLDEQVAAEGQDLPKPLRAELAQERRQEARQLPGPGVEQHEGLEALLALEQCAEADRSAPVVGDQRDVAQVELVDQRERVVDVRLQ